MSRKAGNWIESFLEYTEGVRSPEVYRRWTAVSAIAAAMQRRVYIRVGKQRLYCNLYILLIGPPGVGKSNAIRYAREILRKIASIKLTPSRITAAALYMELEGSKSTLINPGASGPDGMYEYHALTAMISEFGVFARPGNDELLTDLSDLYDCPDPFESKTKHAGESCFPNSWFNILGGTTPKYLKDAWSTSILDEGFPARCLLIYSDDYIDHDPLPDDDEDLAEELDAKHRDVLAWDLGAIGKLKGRFTWHEKARDKFRELHAQRFPPIPSDPRLEHYCQRRVVHLGKLAMVMSAAERDDQEVTLPDLEAGYKLLLRAEEHMTKAVAAITQNPLREVMVMARNFVTKRCVDGKGLPEKELRSFLLREVDPMRMKSTVQEMLHADWIRATDSAEGKRLFYPGKGGAV